MFVLPPLTRASPSITEAMLSYTNVPEEAPDAYSGITTYAEGEFCTDRSVNRFVVYESLADGNLNHTPSSSPLWWKVAGFTFPTYDAGTTFAEDDYVLDLATHRVYQSLVDDNLGAPLSQETVWYDAGINNRWAPFDLLRNTGATGPSPMVYTLLPGTRINGVGLAGMVADRFTLEIWVSGELKWTITQALSYRASRGWLDYFTGEFNPRAASAVFNIPMFSGAQVKLIFERDTGDVTVGAIFVEKAVFLGDVLESPLVSARNFSEITRSFDGVADLVQRRSIPETSQRLVAEKYDVPNLQRMQRELNAVPAFWSGLDDQLDEYFEPLLVVGIYLKFDLIPELPWVMVDIDLEDF